MTEKCINFFTSGDPLRYGRLSDGKRRPWLHAQTVGNNYGGCAFLLCFAVVRLRHIWPAGTCAPKAVNGYNCAVVTAAEVLRSLDVSSYTHIVPKL
jgi:hypothetical protein